MWIKFRVKLDFSVKNYNIILLNFDHSQQERRPNMAKRSWFHYTWYLEPRNDLTNGAIAKCCPEEDFLCGVACADNKRRNLWRCSQDICHTVATSKGAGFSFRVFCEKGNGQIRDVTFLFRKKKRAKRPTPFDSAQSKQKSGG
jgi:hypothetical protein